VAKGTLAVISKDGFTSAKMREPHAVR